MNWELTWGDWHGWHPHRHLLVFHRGLNTIDDELAWVLWEAALRSAWVEAVRSVSPRHTPSDEWGIGVKDENVPLDGSGAYATYMTKAGDYIDAAAFELASPETKQGGMSPFGIQARAAAGDKRALALWGEYQVAVHRKQRMRSVIGDAATWTSERGSGSGLAVLQEEAVDPVWGLLLGTAHRLHVASTPTAARGADDCHRVQQIAVCVGETPPTPPGRFIARRVSPRREAAPTARRPAWRGGPPGEGTVAKPSLPSATKQPGKPSWMASLHPGYSAHARVSAVRLRRGGQCR